MGYFHHNKWEHGILPYIINYSLVTSLVQSFALLYNSTFTDLHISALECSVILHCNVAFSLVTACVIQLSSWRQWYWVFSTIGTIVTCTGLILTSYVESFTLYVLTYGLMTSIGIGMMLPPLLNGSIGDCIYQRRFEFCSVMLGIGGLLPALFPLLITHLIECYDFKGANLIVSALMLNCLVGATLIHFQYKPTNKDTITKEYFAAPIEEKNIPQVPVMLIQGPDDDDIQVHDVDEHNTKKEDVAHDIPSINLDTSNSSAAGSRHPSVSGTSVKSSSSSFKKSGDKWWSKISMGSVYSTSSVRLYDLRAYQSVSGDEDEVEQQDSQQTERTEFKRRGTTDLTAQNLAVPNLTVRRKSDEAHKYSTNSSYEGKEISKSSSMQLEVPSVRSAKRHGSVSSRKSGSSSSSFYITAAHSIKADSSQGSGVWWSTLSLASVYSSGSGRMYNTRDPPIITSEEEEEGEIQVMNEVDEGIELEEQVNISDVNEVENGLDYMEKGQKINAKSEDENKNKTENENNVDVDNSNMKEKSERLGYNKDYESISNEKSVNTEKEVIETVTQVQEENPNLDKKMVLTYDVTKTKDINLKEQTLVSVEIHNMDSENETNDNKSVNKETSLQMIPESRIDLNSEPNEPNNPEINLAKNLNTVSTSKSSDFHSEDNVNENVQELLKCDQLKHDSSLVSEKSNIGKNTPLEHNTSSSDLRVTGDTKSNRRRSEPFIEQVYVSHYRRDWKLLGDPTSLNVCLGIALSTCADYSFIIILPFIMSDLNMSNEEISLVIFTMTIVDILSRILVSSWTKSIKINYKYLYFVGLIALAISRSLFRHFTSFYSLLFAGAVTGFSRGIKSIHCSIIIPEHIPLHTRSSPVYLHVVAHWLVYMMLGLVLGFMRDADGRYNNCIVIINILTVAGIGLCSMETVFYIIQKKLDSRAVAKSDKQTDKLLS